MLQATFDHVQTDPPDLHAFDARAFLDASGIAGCVVDYRPGETIHEQGDPSDTVLYIQHELLHEQHALADRFIAHIIARNSRLEEDLLDQLFNAAEKRLARTLLLLARCGKANKRQPVLRPIPQEVLAEMVGTTRSRVNVFMKKFRKFGFIDYDSNGITVHSALLSAVLRDGSGPGP